jgi:type III pantothenate kinase
MIIAVDIGNTHTSIGTFQNNKLIKKKTIDEREFKSLPDGFALNKPEAVVVSSVVPSRNSMISEEIESRFGISPIFVNAEMSLSIKISYKSPKDLGPDRFSNIFGGRELVGLPLCAIDAGTAITLDVVSKDNEYIGGVIMSGINTEAKALENKTELLPSINIFEPVPTFLGNTTKECIASGIYWSKVYGSKGILERIKSDLNHKLNVIVTGGAGNLIAEELDLSYEPWLTLIGLNVIYNELSRK